MAVGLQPEPNLISEEFQKLGVPTETDYWEFAEYADKFARPLSTALKVDAAKSYSLCRGMIVKMNFPNTKTLCPDSEFDLEMLETEEVFCMTNATSSKFPDRGVLGVEWRITRIK